MAPTTPRRLRPARLALLALVLLAPGALGSGVGCGVADEPRAAEALRLRFPDRAAAVLDRGEALDEADDGFARRGGDPLGATLLAAGDDTLRLRLADGLEVRVREEGASRERTLHGRALTYPREGGASFWSAVPGGLEEWLMIDAGRAHGGAVAAWEVRGLAVEQHGDAVSLVDERGVHRVWITAPVAYAASGREVPVRLAATGARIEIAVDAGGEAVLVDPLWTQVAPMSQGRLQFTLTALPGGKVLAAGGYNASAPALATAEVYDVATNIWSPAGAMSTLRRFHTATYLPIGAVLVTGGNDGTSSLAGADIYDPSSNAWFATGAMAHPREFAAAALLANGDVLVTGGASGAVAQATAEIYSPITGVWTGTGPMSTPRMHHTATSLQGGRVLAIGGFDGTSYLGSAEQYVPAGGSWTSAASVTPRAYHTATLLGSGKVFMTGGFDGTIYLDDASLWTPATNTWAAAPSMSNPRARHGATLLGTTVLVAGGFTGIIQDSTAQTYDPATSTWATSGSMNNLRSQFGMVTLGPTKAMAAGGYDGVATLKNVDIYTVGTLGTACSTAADCLSGFCVDGVCCNSACGSDPFDCQACSIAAGAPANGTCAQLTGKACNDGNGCTLVDTCQAGVCVGASPVVCPAATPCRDQGVCLPATGTCTTPDKPSGTPCDDGDLCTQTDTCQGGVCFGANPVICPIPTQCQTMGTCNAATGTCTNPNRPDGSMCNDGTACTKVDVCMAGACVGTQPVVCASIGQCYDVGTCNAVNGTCTNPPKANGAACTDGNACTQGDACMNGICAAGAPVVCAAMDGCHDPGFCDMTTGQCSNPTKPDGLACSDGNACTKSDKCMAGVCKSTTPVTCGALDECHLVGTCDPTSGCDHPTKPDGTPCSMGTCQAGVCGTGSSSSSGSASSSTSASGSSTSTASSGGTGGAGGGGVGGGMMSGASSSGASSSGASSSGASSGGGAGGGSASSSGAGGAGAGSASSSSGEGTGAAGGGASSSSGGTGMEGGCGCGVGSSPVGGGVGVGIGLLLMMRRRRRG